MNEFYAGGEKEPRKPEGALAFSDLATSRLIAQAAQDTDVTYIEWPHTSAEDYETFLISRHEYQTPSNQRGSVPPLTEEERDRIKTVAADMLGRGSVPYELVFKDNIQEGASLSARMWQRYAELKKQADQSASKDN